MKDRFGRSLGPPPSEPELVYSWPVIWQIDQTGVVSFQRVSLVEGLANQRSNGRLELLDPTSLCPIGRARWWDDSAERPCPTSRCWRQMISLLCREIPHLLGAEYPQCGNPDILVVGLGQDRRQRHSRVDCLTQVNPCRYDQDQTPKLPVLWLNANVY